MNNYDVIVIGSGFGGSVSALRLTEKGCVPQYRVDGRLPKWLAAALAYLRHPVLVLRTATTYRWSERTIIGLVTQSLDFLGGCPIGEDPEHGVIDPYHRLYGHPGISVVDGAAVSANLGVNPSLTITAQAERAMALWPSKGEPDPRPSQGGAYIRLSPVAPRSPAVPAGAYSALRY